MMMMAGIASMNMPMMSVAQGLVRTFLNQNSCGEITLHVIMDQYAQAYLARRTVSKEISAVLAAETLGREDAGAAGVIGAGVNGRAVARTFATALALLIVGFLLFSRVSRHLGEHL